MGKLSDHYGRKPLLIISQFSTFISFIVLGFANTIGLIILSRIIDGLLGSNFSIAQAYLSDISSKKDRSKVFGLSGVAFGFGFLVGPAIGGYLAEISSLGFGLPCFISAGISLLTIFLTAFFLKETVKKKKKKMIFRNLFHFNNFKKYFSNKDVSSLLWQFFFYLICHITFTSQMALFTNKQFGFKSKEVGFLLAYVGLNSIIQRGVVLPKLIDYFGEKKLLNLGIFSVIIGLIISSIINKGWMLVFAITFFSTGAGVIRPLLVGGVSKKVSGKEQGAILGITNSLGSLAQMIGPLIGGFVLSYFAPGILPLTSAFFMGLVLVMIIKNSKKSINY